MKYHTTFAFEGGTTRSIKSLAKPWKVSQAEVVRRSGALAEKPISMPGPVALLQQLHALGDGLVAETAKTYLAEVCEDRKSEGHHDLPGHQRSDPGPSAR